MSVDSYNSKYPKTYYKAGEVYSFYYSPKNTKTTREATEKEISSFAPRLKKAIAGVKTTIDSRGGSEHLGRSYGVVVAIESKQDEEFSRLSVMFANDEDFSHFIVKQYAIEYSGVLYDEKEVMTPGVVTTTRNDISSAPISDNPDDEEQSETEGSEDQPETEGSEDQPETEGGEDQPETENNKI